eukprot:m.52638 g.52638  ORF g.52638 m.52638 type:complete len:208 (-) comp12314_c0_seq2:297-920(-)
MADAPSFEDPSVNDHKQLRHPVATFFHLFFRSAAVIVFLLCGFFSNSFVVDFVVIVMLLSFDFWTVKNISGRLLVGLRWWNQVDEDGQSRWVFEARKNDNSHPTEVRIFWWSLYIYPIVWCLFILTSFLKAYMLIVIVALALNAANVIGYTKCQKDATARLQSAGTYVGQTLISYAASSLFSGGTGSSSDNSGSTASGGSTAQHARP